MAGESKEARYIAQLKELGVYNEAFDPVIHELCILERERSRALKAWKDTKPPGAKCASFSDPLYGVLRQIRADILVHQDALGLTPKGLKKLKGTAQKTTSTMDTLNHVLDALKEAANGES